MLYSASILRKWLLICLCLFAVAFALWWFQSTAFAAQSESQLIHDTESQASVDSKNYGQTLNTANQWLPVDTEVSFYLKTTAQTYLTIYAGGHLTETTFWNYSRQLSQEQIPSNFDGIYTFTISSSTVQAMIDDDWNSMASRGFRINFDTADSGRVWGSSNSNSYSAGLFFKSSPVVEFISDDNVKDAYFEILAYIDAIEITFPENATTTPDFAAWQTEFSVKDTPPVYGSLKLNYGTSSSTLTSFDILNFEAYDNESTPANIPKALLLLPYTTYYAQANILDASSTIIATSTLIYFNTSGIGEFYENNYYTIPTSTIATSTPIQITCDPDDPWYSYSLCKLAVWLFVPSPATLNQFSTLGDTLKNKPPIGYFYRVKDALVFSSTSTPAFNLENASTTLAASIYNPLKTGITFLFWLVFGFWVFNRIRHLEL